MQKYDYFIVTDDLILTRFINKDWQEYEFGKYHNQDIMKKNVDFFVDKKLFVKDIKNIYKGTCNSFLNKVFGVAKHAMVLYTFSGNTESRIELIDESLYFNKHYRKITNCSIGLAVAGVSELNEDYLPLLIISVIGNFVDFSFCFTGATIFSRHCKGIFQNEFDDFYRECLKLREKTLSLSMDVSCFPPDVLEVINKTWDGGVNFKTIMASNNLESAQKLISHLPIDMYVNFTEVIEVIEERQIF